MAGRNNANFRSGNWSEELGVLLLKGLAAVAPVPRQDDFGLDAIATLLRKGRTDNCLYAEESFYVQFKSIGTKSITYRDHEIAWLKGLQLPFFIGVVDRETSRLNLFPTHETGDVFIASRDFNEVKVHLAARGEKKRNIEDKSLEVFLGPPLLSFAIGDISDVEFATNAYGLLKEFLCLEQRNVNARPMRFLTRLSWTTNGSVSITGSANTLSRAQRKEELHGACETMVPCIRLASMYASANHDKDLTTAITELVGQFRRIFSEREYFDESETSYIEWSDPLEAVD